jgi:hypothetical protein
MLEEMRMRQLAPKTRDAYIRAVLHFAVSGDPIVVLFSRFDRRRFLRPYSSAEIYLNRFLPVDFVGAVVGARAVPAAMHA